MIPKFLEEFKSEIEKYRLDSIKIKATPISEKESLSIQQSKFLGKPFLPLHSEYPRSKDGKPMIMLAQINFEEVPTLEGYPVKGLLQFFVSATNWYDMDDYQILFYENLSLEYQSDFSFLTKELYEESPIYCEHKLIFTKVTEYGGPSDNRFQMDFNGMDYYHYLDTISEEQQKELNAFFDTAGHKIGGYAFFTQSDPRDYDSNLKNDILLLQIDTDEEIMFGDSGVANIFISPENLKTKKIGKAYFNWDCC